MLTLVLAVVSIGAFAQSREGLSTYTLDNGLTVYLWEDHDMPDVIGYVSVRAGSIDEPMEYTGLAHYLEHMLFKGTERIGSMDWEKEKPLYEQIIRLYDEFSDATDPKVREELTQKINEASLEAAKYATTEDFFALMDYIGAEEVNAYTSYDLTCYHNHFPANQMQRWLTIFSDRFDKPVFRTFQAELENVFEEYNMYEDNVNSHIRKALFAESYAGHPYERDVIGVPDHLKNPRLSKLIEFYNTWYVPNNMALILVGDFDSESTKPLIEQTFGKMQSKPLPERKQYPNKQFTGNPKKNFKIGYTSQAVWVYNGVNMNDKDLIPIEFTISLLNNNSNTGLLDKLTLDGEVGEASVMLDARRDIGRLMIMAQPSYDVAQQRYESFSATEKIIQKEIDKLREGQIDDWLFDLVKRELKQNYKLAFENEETKVQSLIQCFIYQQPIDNIFNELDRYLAVTKEDVKRIANTYFTGDHLTLQFEEGTPKKNKLAKPKIKPLEPVQGAETEYAKAFKQIPAGSPKEEFVNFADVKEEQLDENIKLYYTPNPDNDIFSLTLRYGVGTEKMPMLEYAVNLMNKAGVMPETTPQQFRRQLAELGARCHFSVNSSYLFINIVGEDANLEKICELINRQIFMPKLDEKQFESVRSSAWISRYMISKIDDVQADALYEYLVYGDKSEYIDVLPFMDIYKMTYNQVNSSFINATKYALEAHYVGTRTIEDVKKALPLQEDVKSSESPYIRDRVKHDKTEIYFLANSNVQQASVYFYFEGKPYSIDQAVDYQAFDQYFSGGFTGLVLDEIRAKRSMAYTATGYAIPPAVQGKNSYFRGYIGTQSDKVADAIDVFMSLLADMPKYPDRLVGLKASLRQSALSNKPDFRNKSRVISSWKLQGYNDDPARMNLPKIDALEFEQITRFYEENIKGQPVTIIVVGDPKLVDTKQLQAKYGKILKVSKSKLFAPLEIDL